MFEKLLAKVAFSLKRHNIPYMVIGGQAVLLYGAPRLTKDIDITLGVGIDKLSDVVNTVKDAGLEILPKDSEGFVKKTFVLPTRDRKSKMRVDFIFSFTPYERQAISRVRDIVISGTKIKFASLEDIIIHKVFSCRARDLEDVRSMLIKNPDYDMAYIKKWLGEFDKLSEEKKFTSTFKNILKTLKH
ncbi:MAG: nucleotidyl transferase AbiEii/AbiGii toxin family protein [Nitrospirae bacterium]|nr:nucleotidyl transferase AbiEii/AbiGii toxin family protein [Nitrospirota bacterium]